MTESHEIILQRSIKRDRDAFRKLVERYQSYAFKLAFRLLCHEEDARDVVQESFIRVWKHLPKYNPQNKFTTWLYRIVTNLCYDRIKAESRRAKVFSFGFTEHYPGSTAISYSLEDQVGNKEIAERIIQIANNLKTKQRMVFVLRDLHDLSIREVSEILSITTGSVKSNLYHARRNIRKKLEALGIMCEKRHEPQRA